MKKSISSLIAVIVVLSSIAFADVVFFLDGTIDLFGMKMQSRMAATILCALIAIIAIVGIVIVCKRAQSKRTKTISSIGIILVALVLSSFFARVIDSNSHFNHGGWQVLDYEDFEE